MTAAVRYFILDEDGRTPVPIDDEAAWRRWMAEADQRLVARADIVKRVCVVTRFAGTDDVDPGHEPPLIWETLVFGDAFVTSKGVDLEDVGVHYCATYAEALEDHDAMVRYLKAGGTIARLKVGDTH